MSVGSIQHGLEHLPFEEMKHGGAYFLVPDIKRHHEDDNGIDLDEIIDFIRKEGGKVFFGGCLYTIQEGRRGTFILKFKLKERVKTS